jgi:GTP-binding protein
MPKLPLVAVLGRPNVGKSTLVNRIIARSEAIVHSQAGVTRDRNYFEGEWRGKLFRVVDTGGMAGADESELTKKIVEQSLQALDEADIALLLTDVTAGVTPGDLQIAEGARKTGKPLLAVVNKVDSGRRELDVAEFYRLGMGEPLSISAMHGLGIGELLDAIFDLLPEPEDEQPEEEERTVAIVGRPNVGKSSLFNRLIRAPRAIVSDIAGTTRDAIDTSLRIGDREYRFIDTAGWRRRTRVTESVEYYSMVRVWRAIDRAQVVLLVIDASEGVTDQDQKIAARVAQDGTACVVVLNKWDLVPEEAAREALEDARYQLRFVAYAPFVRASALTGAGMKGLIGNLEKAHNNWTSRISTSLLNATLVREVNVNPPPSFRGRVMKLYYVTQSRVAPPEFVFFVNDAKLVKPAYRRFLERRIREHFDFTGTPLRIAIRSKKAP